MNFRTKIQVGAGLLFLMASALAQAIPLLQIIEGVSKRTGKNFIVDPRVQADVTLAGKDINTISYDDLLEILQVHGFVAIERGSFTKIVPDANARTLGAPLISGSEKHPDAQFVSKVIPVKNMPAAFLVPLLRPLLPQHAHLVAVACTNTLMMVDTYGNVKRVESLVKALDTGEPYKAASCVASADTPSGSAQSLREKRD
jgi:type II secretory pathway component GspD/PulD (secretin)